MVEPLLEAEGLEVVEVEYRREPIGMVLRIFIDTPGGINLDVCSRASAVIDMALDEGGLIESAYHLEVSSPGLERRLAKPAHFQRFAGEIAQIRLTDQERGRKKFTGVIMAADDESVTLEVDGVRHRLEYGRIARASLKYTDW